MMNPPHEALLPRNLRAQLQEHTAGGYLLFKISENGNVQHILEYDDEKSYLAIMKKLDVFRKTMDTIDERMSFANMIAGSMGMDDDEEFDDDEEDDLQGM